MTLSIVILCWNDLAVISNCLQSIFAGSSLTDFEVIVSDNGSTDGSVEYIRKTYPAAQVIENGANLRFSKGNNVGIERSTGEYVLILNPDTIIHEGALDRWVAFADEHPEAGAFGCRVLNPDGSYQGSAQPFPSLGGDLIGALYLRPLTRLLPSLPSDTYTRWNGDSERTIDWQCGCCVMLRRDVLKSIGGFDERFFYYYEDVDICHQVWKTGYTVRYTPDVTITHLGGQSTQRAPHAFEIDKYRNRYRYFYKYYGPTGASRCRLVSLTSLILRYCGYTLVAVATLNPRLKDRLALYKTAIRWNWRVNPISLVENGADPARQSAPIPQA